MSSDTRIPPDSGRRMARKTNTSRPEQKRPPAMGMPDILAMTSNGRLAAGKRVTLPSGAVWEGGKVSGTSVLTLPDHEPVLVDADAPPNTIAGTAVRIDALASALRSVLGIVPRLFADWAVASVVGRHDPKAEQGQTRTRIVKVSARTSFPNPAVGAGPSAADHQASEQLRDDATASPSMPDAGIAGRAPRGFSQGGRVSGPGGPRADAIVARLSNGEFVVNSAATGNFLPLLEAINSGWVPTLADLAGLFPGFADGGLVGAGDSSGRWRDLIGNTLVAPIRPSTDGLRGSDFGIGGLAGDIFGGLANAALHAGGRVGSALGSAIAPAFGPGGLLTSLFGARSGETARLPAEAVGRASGDTGGPVPLTGSLQVNPDGVPGVPSTGQAFGRSTGAGTTGFDQMGLLAKALGQGLESAAIDAGSGVGAALGAAIAPALGPAGPLAVQIGTQLGSMLGAEFGGSLRASMTLSGTTGPNPAGGGTDGAESGGNGRSSAWSVLPRRTGSGTDESSVVGAQPAPVGGGTAQEAGEGSRIVWSGGGGLSVGGLVDSLRVNPRKRVEGAEGTDGALVVPGGGFGPLRTLEQQGKPYNGDDGNVGDLTRVAGSQLGSDLGTALAPWLGERATTDGGALGGWLGGILGDAAVNADPNGLVTPGLAAELGRITNIPFKPKDQQKPQPQQMTSDQQIGLAAVTGGVTGLQQHGLLGGLTGAISGAASTAGGLAGGAIGTAIAPFLGPLGAIAPVVGQFLGSMVAGTAAEFITKPIEWAGNAIKEEVGSGFGLTDLAKGPGGHTARGDIYNFNGMDPKSAAISVERVRRRRSVAQQRGGGLGR